MFSEYWGAKSRFETSGDVIWHSGFQGPRGSCIEEEFGGRETAVGSQVSGGDGLVGRGLKVEKQESREGLAWAACPRASPPKESAPGSILGEQAQFL